MEQASKEKTNTFDVRKHKLSNLGFCSRKRMRRKRRSKRILGNPGPDGVCRVFNYWDSEEENDPDSPCLTSSLASNHNLGRRANISRNLDLEQGNT